MLPKASLLRASFDRALVTKVAIQQCTCRCKPFCWRKYSSVCLLKLHPLSITAPKPDGIHTGIMEPNVDSGKHLDRAIVFHAGEPDHHWLIGDHSKPQIWPVLIVWCMCLSTYALIDCTLVALFLHHKSKGCCVVANAVCALCLC